MDKQCQNCQLWYKPGGVSDAVLFGNGAADEESGGQWGRTPAPSGSVQQTGDLHQQPPASASDEQLRQGLHSVPGGRGRHCLHRQNQPHETVHKRGGNYSLSKFGLFLYDKTSV